MVDGQYSIGARFSTIDYGQLTMDNYLSPMFHRICLAFAFSPRAEALLAEAARFTILFNARLTVLHVGQLTDEQYQNIKDTLLRYGLEEGRSYILCDSGVPTKVILNTCSKTDID